MQTAGIDRELNALILDLSELKPELDVLGGKREERRIERTVCHPLSHALPRHG